METQQINTLKDYPGKQNTHKTIGLLALLCSLLVLVSACGSLVPQTVTMNASWAQYYRSMKDLKQHSDVAVRGFVSQIAPAVKTSDGLVYSMVTITVNHVLWSHQKKTFPRTITIQQTGGEVDNVTYVTDDDPLFKMNEQVILFLQEFQPGQFRVSGGPSGRFIVKNGIVTPVAPDAVKLSANTNETQFSADLQNP